MNRNGNAAVGVFLFMIIAFAMVVCLGVFVYVANTTSTALHSQLDGMSTAELNYTQIINETIDEVPASYQVLRWGSFVLIMGMIISIFIGSYLVNTRPVFFIPYIILSFVAIILSVVMSNVYDDILMTNNELGAVLMSFVASNYILLYLPTVVSIVCFVGGIIMFASYKLGQEQSLYVQ